MLVFCSEKLLYLIVMVKLSTNSELLANACNLANKMDP